LVGNIKKYGNHITNMLSYNDLIQLGGYTAIEYMGGPSMIFRMGRTDADESAIETSTDLMLTSAHENAVQVAQF